MLSKNLFILLVKFSSYEIISFNNDFKDFLSLNLDFLTAVNISSFLLSERLKIFLLLIISSKKLSLLFL